MKYKFRVLFMQLVRHIIRSVGGVLLSKQVFDNLLTQRDSAVIELSTIESRIMEAGLAGVVVSKDRALQLYSLLISYHELVSNPAPLTVIYTASTSDHANAYEEVKILILEMNIDAKFIQEFDGFKNTLTNALDAIRVKNIFFLVDDIVFIRKVDLAFACALDTSRYVLSLRHSPYLTHSYTANRHQTPPRLSKFKDVPGMFEFRWFEQGCEWSNPLSLDGQVLSTAEVRVITKTVNFSAPNSYESALKSFNTFFVKRYGLCYFESKILNLPINRVQNECENLSGSVSPEYLLDQWNMGLMLDTTSLLTHVPVSPHEEHPITFKMRSAELIAIEK